MWSISIVTTQAIMSACYIVRGSFNVGCSSNEVLGIMAVKCASLLVVWRVVLCVFNSDI